MRSAQRDVVGRAILVLTALPAGVFPDGYTVDIQNAAMAAKGIRWRFAYNASSASAYKWELVGGSALGSYMSIEAKANTAYEDLATVQNFIAPVTAEYEISFGGGVYNATVGYQYCGFHINFGLYIEAVTWVPDANAEVPFVNYHPAAPIAVGQDARLRFRANAGTASWAYRFMSIKPVRASA